MLTLKDEQTTQAAREPIVRRIGELRHDIAERQATMSALREQVPASPADPQVVADLLATLPCETESYASYPSRN